MKKQQNHYKSNRFGGRHSHKPAELFRTDFITAMKLPDTESLDDESYWVIKDQWKLDWEKGVQVPVKPECLPTPNCVVCKDQFDLPIELAKSIGSNPNMQLPTTSANKENGPKIPMPKKYLCPANDKNYRSTIHEAYITHGLSTNPTPRLGGLTTTNNNSDDETSTSSSSSSSGGGVNDGVDRSVCKYDCDQMDMAWLSRVNTELDVAGVERIGRLDLERLIENFELQAYESLKQAIDKLQSYSIEYDEDIVCDVCREPDSEENNEMVFCDGCNMCVHQACYGIETIPKGNWLCAPCTFGGPQFRPECVLCPQTSGAMKATKNFRHWAHVSCALWIPETSFGNADKMEPIMNLNAIAPARWQLVCSLCKEKRGCCLQCSEKRCHAAFHVTCGFKYGLEMKTLIADSDSDSGGAGGGGDGSDAGDSLMQCAPSGSLLASSNGQVIFRAYCQKHTKRRAQMQQEGLLEEEEEEEEGDEDDDEDEDEDDEDEEENDEDDEPDEDARSEEVKSEPNDANTTSHQQLPNVREDEKNFFSSLSKMSESERKLEIIKQIKLLNYEFYKNVSLTQTERQLSIKNPVHLQLVFNYWKLKRRYNISTISASKNCVMPIQNKPLIVYRSDQDLINRSERLLIAKIRECIHLRQSLENVRNLCYMVIRRERMKSSLFRLNQQLFSKQIDYVNRYCSQSDLSMLSTSSSNRGGRLKEILQFKNDQCIYDLPEQWNKDMDTVTSTTTTTTMNTIHEEEEEEDESESNKVVDEITKTESKAKKSTKKNIRSRIEKKKRTTLTTKKQNKIVKNIVQKYNMLNYRRNHNKRRAAAAVAEEEEEVEEEANTVTRLRTRSTTSSAATESTKKKRPAATSARKRISKIPSFRFKLRSSRI